MIVLNFSPPHGECSTGIICSDAADPKLGNLHADLEDCTLMGCRLFGTGNAGPERITYTTKGKVRAYVHYRKPVPEGFERLGLLPVDVLRGIAIPGSESERPRSLASRIATKQPPVRATRRRAAMPAERALRFTCPSRATTPMAAVGRRRFTRSRRPCRPCPTTKADIASSSARIPTWKPISIRPTRAPRGHTISGGRLRRQFGLRRERLGRDRRQLPRRGGSCNGSLGHGIWLRDRRIERTRIGIQVV